jgi:chorismate dehydratase
MKLKIGEIEYSNCTPIYTTLKERFDCGGYEFIKGEPALLNKLLAKGEIDVSPSSSIEYARHWDDYLIIPDISIGSSGNVGSILFFSKGPIEDLGGARIAVSSASATSVVMLKALLRFRYGKEAVFSAIKPDLDLMLKGHDAALLIGDAALKEGKNLPVKGLHVYDLGRLWQEYAGLPFVYALWMVRKDSAYKMPELCRRLKEDLKAAREKAEGSFDSIALNAPESAWMGVEGLAAYWKSMLSYRLGPEHRRGLMLFLELAERLGEAPLPPAMRFL